MKKIEYLVTFVLILFVSIYGCKKDKTDLIDNQTTSSKDNNVADGLFADIQRVVEEAADDEGKSSRIGGYSFGACAVVSVTPAWSDTTYPKLMTIDFGTTNCAGEYNVNRRGKIEVSLSDRYRNDGSVLTIQPEDYFVNDIKVEGTKTLSNNGYNLSDNLEYNVAVANGKITYTDGTTTSWESNRTSEWIEGDSTTLFTNGLSGICDDVYLIKGSGNGVNRNGLSYKINILSGSPLRKEVCCRWLVSGELEITPAGLSVRSVNYGAGTCDALATVAVNGNIYNVTMLQ